MIPANNHPEIDRLIHLKKHLGGMTMSKLISCQFNIDTACVELVFDDGSQLSIDSTAVENEVADNRFQRSELDYLIYNDPLAYADLVLNGDPEAYLNAVTDYEVGLHYRVDDYVGLEYIVSDHDAWLRIIGYL